LALDVTNASDKRTMKSTAEIETPEVRLLAERAEAFVADFAWCERVKRCSLAFAVAGVVGVFRIDLVPAAGRGADSAVWAIVGDIPSAYIVLEDGDTWQDALRGYVEEMERWVDAVRLGASIETLIPVTASPTREHADILAGRLAFLREHLIEVDPISLDGDV
jgi:hypothetical protein